MDLTLFAGADKLIEFIKSSTLRHEKEAFMHHLNQGSQEMQGPSQKALFQTAAGINACINTLQLQAKSETMTVDITFYAYTPITGAAAKKQFKASDIADNVLDEVVTWAQGVYESIPSAPKVMPEFTWNSVTFAVNVDANTHHLIEPCLLVGSLSNLHTILKAEKRLLKKDITNGVLGLRVFLYEKVQPDNDNDIEFLPNSVVRSPRKRTKKRKALDQDDDSAICTSAIWLSAHFASAQNGTSLNKKHASAHRPYTSTFHSNRKTSDSLRFNRYQFTRIEASVSADGEVRLISDPRTETILIAKDWQQYITGGLREGGYIGKGYSKFAFEGRLRPIPVAIFQMRPIGDPSDQDLNQRDMIAELLLLALRQYFLDAFYRRAKAYHVKGLPELEWNSAGTFVGQVTSELPPPPASIADKDTRSLLYNMFLAAPLLETRDIEPGYKEVKYSGTDCASQNTDILGVAVDAFAHHTLVDSQGTLVFVDLQGLIKPSGKFVIYNPQIQRQSRGLSRIL
ncbi:predicted protein [Postia placenta Mad-698-R]|nr:predicted protein [Postia placenta Mad-698-R]